MIKYSLTEEVLGYETAPDPTNTDKKHLVYGSQNVLVDRQKKVRTRNGFTRFGAGNASLTPVTGGKTWHTSTGIVLPLRHYDDEFEAYLGTVDGVAVDAWTRVVASLHATNTKRACLWFDAAENMDLYLFVQGDDDMREWNGAVAIVDSITGTTITKKGTTTFAQNRFYTTRDKHLTCVRTGTDYTYTGGETTTTLTGIADTTGLIDGDILVQKVKVDSDTVSAGRNNHTIFSHENQIYLGSDDDEEVYMSQNDDYDDFTYSTPRAPGEGALLTLDANTKGFGVLSDKVVVFAGRDSIFSVGFEQITVGTTLTEQLRVKKLQTGVNHSAVNQEVIVPLGDSLIYLSQEPAVRLISQPNEIEGAKPQTLSNPIKPDFDAEDFSNANATWYKNAYFLSAPNNSRVYILEFIEDADGRLRRYWQPPQTLPVRSFMIFNSLLYGHSNSVPETYNLFANDTYSDLIVNGTNGDPADKLPINCKARFAYQSFGARANQKDFDEYYVEGEISTNTTDLLFNLNYDFAGATGMIERTVSGADEDIRYGQLVQASLGQNPLAQYPLGGSLTVPESAFRFRVIFEYAKEDFHEIQPEFSTNELDRFWSIIAHGPNVAVSTRRNNLIYK